MKKSKQFESLIYSAAGIAVMFVILVAVYVISGAIKVRIDLTEENLYTLSPGTREILQQLDTPVQVRFYYSQSSREMPVMLKTYAERVEDLLQEYRKASGGKIEIQKFDPQPDTDAEDKARFDGVEGQMVNLGDRIYLGLAVSQLDAKAVLPFLSPDRERLLEYDLSRAIASVTTSEKPTVGVMSSLSLFGEFNPMMMRMGQTQRQEPWVFVSELQRDFEVQQIETTVDQIPSEVDLLLVVHPKNLADKTLYAIDQFLLGGGELVVFVDPLSVIDSQSAPQNNPLQAASNAGSNLEKLFQAWGITFDSNKVVADMNLLTRINRGGREESSPAVLSLTPDVINREDVVTAEIDSLVLPFPGAFSGTPAEGLTQTILLKTSESSQTVDRFMAQFSGDQITRDFAPSGREMTLALRLTGKFKTAFPDGKPADTAAEGEAAPAAESGESLKESAKDSAVVLVGDTDFLYDAFAARVQNIFGNRIVIPVNGNLTFVQNTTEQLAGDSNLISVRSRATMSRPFTVVRQMQADAEARYRGKIKELEDSLQEAQNRLNELQRAKGDGNQRFILSPEQQEEIERFQQKQAEVNQELRRVRRDLRKEIDSLENRLKWINIAGMPVLVTLGGLGLALVKRRKTAAK